MLNSLISDSAINFVLLFCYAILKAKIDFRKLYSQAALTIEYVD